MTIKLKEKAQILKKKKLKSSKKKAQSCNASLFHYYIINTVMLGTQAYNP